MDFRSSFLLTMVLTGLLGSVAVGGPARGWILQDSATGAALVEPGPSEALGSSEPAEGARETSAGEGQQASLVRIEPNAVDNGNDVVGHPAAPPTSSGPASDMPAAGGNRTDGDDDPMPAGGQAKAIIDGEPASGLASGPFPDVTPRVSNVESVVGR